MRYKNKISEEIVSAWEIRSRRNGLNFLPSWVFNILNLNRDELTIDNMFGPIHLKDGDFLVKNGESISIIKNNKFLSTYKKFSE